MVKCPKCNFEQPEDIYCASCGVKMASVRVRGAPIYQSWMFKVGLLTVAIIALVMYDRQKSSSSPAPNVATQNAATTFTKTADSAESAPPPPTTTNVAASSTSSAESVPPPMSNAVNSAASKRFARQTNPQGVQKTAAGPNENIDTKASGNLGLKPIMRVTFYQGSRNALQELHRESQVNASAGDASGGIVNQKKLQSLVSSAELRSLGGSRYRDYDAQNPVVVFKGQRGTGEGGRNIGLYFQITPMRQDTTSASLEIKSWGNVKLQDTDENLFSTEMTLNSQSSAFISGFLPRDKTFTDEEKTIFESDNTLKIYNQDDFWDNSTDLIMVVELSAAP